MTKESEVIRRSLAAGHTHTSRARLVYMTVAGARSGLPLGAVKAQPQAERWKRDRKPTNSRLQVATNSVPGFTRERGSERGVGSDE